MRKLKFAALVAFVLALAACISFAVPRDMSLMGGAPYEGTADASVTHTPTKYGSSTPWGGDLAGSSNTSQLVSGIRGHQLPALAVGALSYDGGSWYFGASGGGGSFTAGGDLAGTSTSQTVTGLTGSAGVVLVNATALQSASANTSLTIGTNKAGATLALQADAASTVATLDATGAVIGKTSGGDFGLRIAPLIGQETSFVGMWAGAAAIAPTAFNYTMAMTATSFSFNGSVNIATTGGYNDVTIGAGGARGLEFNNGDSSITPSAGTTLTIGAPTGNISTVGSVQLTTRTVTSSFTIDTTTTDYVILADTSGGVLTITLPAPTNGRSLLIVDKTNSFGTHNCTLARHGSEKIDGSAANQTLSSTGMRRRITSDGTDWYTEN